MRQTLGFTQSTALSVPRSRTWGGREALLCPTSNAARTTPNVFSDVRKAAMSLSGNGGSGNKGNAEDDGVREMNVFQKNGRQRKGIEQLPFDVSIVSPPPRYLGRFHLDPSTHCGDIVEHEGEHFEVKVVRLLYRYRQGHYRVVGKRIEVKSLARKVLEVYLERKFEQS